MKLGANISMRPVSRTARHAFTLLELLVVIAIMGILVAIGLPSVRNMTKSNALIAANQQFRDDISYARQRAIADHTTVYIIFVPPSIVTFTQPTDPVALRQYTNLYGGQYTTYALLSLRSIGEQPGRASPRYLTGWRSLPSGVFIAAQKFGPYNAADPDPLRAFPVASTFPFPYISTNALPAVTLPYIGFDYLGRLITARDEYIPIARGSIFYARDAGGNFIPQPADLQESPPNNSVNNSNVVHIDWLTGRVKIERQEVQ